MQAFCTSLFQSFTSLAVRIVDRHTRQRRAPGLCTCMHRLDVRAVRGAHLQLLLASTRGAHLPCASLPLLN